MESTQFILTRDDTHLSHHGVKGQRWGVRRYQNEDGSLTAKGEKQRAKIEKWYDSGAGRRERNNFQRNGQTSYDAYKAHRTAKGVGIGWFVAGIAGGIVGGVVSSKRVNAGRQFFESEIVRLEKKSA